MEKDVKTQELTVANNDMVDILKDQYGIEIYSFDHELDIARNDLIPVPNNLMAEMSVAVSKVPTLKANEMADEALRQQAYRITFKGKDVRPDQLWQKKDGSFISNLKGKGNELGKQTDITALDNAATQSAMVASSVFAVASMATGTYYMKNIDDQLAELKTTTKNILDFLEHDKQAGIEADMKLLSELASNLEEIKSNPDLKAVKINQFSKIQREALKNIRFYEKEIGVSLDDFNTKKKLGQKVNPSVERLRQQYYYYRICLQEYSITKAMEIQLTNNFEETPILRAREEVEKLSGRHKELSNKILSDVYDKHFGAMEAKALKGIAASLDFMSGIIEKTPLGKKTEIDEKLAQMSEKAGEATKHKAKEAADRIVDRGDYGLIEPVVDNLKKMEDMVTGEIEYICQGEKAYLRVLSA